MDESIFISTIKVDFFRKFSEFIAALFVLDWQVATHKTLFHQKFQMVQ